MIFMGQAEEYELSFRSASGGHLYALCFAQPFSRLSFDVCRLISHDSRLTTHDIEIFKYRNLETSLS